MGNGDEDAPGDKAPAPAQPGTYDQAFFHALAAKGKEAWNAWRRDSANEEVHVTFAGIDFSEHPNDKIDFSGFEFGDNANFSGCKWRGGEWEDGRALVQILERGHIARKGAFRERAFLCRALMNFSRVAISSGKLSSCACAGICGSSSVSEIWWR